jgi:osmoprotectant transport system permease protein
MRADEAKRLGIATIGDLARHPALAIGLSNEFVDRADGWPALARAYGLGGLQMRGIDHDLAYRALAAGQIAVTDVYTTDAEIATYKLLVLRDDRAFFPRYDAVFVYRAGLSAKAVAALDALAGSIDEAEMRELNRKVTVDKLSETEAARFALGEAPTAGATESRWRRLADRTLEHLWLVGVSLLAALLVAIPLGIVAARNRRLGGLVLATTGVLQTIPSLALFVMLIPLLGIGAAPTIAALFLYSLLPVVRNTHAGLTGISPALIDSADALGLSRWARLRRIELPLALPMIMAGVRTAAVIAVGLATLGAVIGAGGYGQPILTGIRLNDTALILDGAVPAAVMALMIEGLFQLLQTAVTPRGLRGA